MNLTQILRNQDATLTLSVYADGDLSDEGTATVTLTDLGGTVVDTLPVTDNADGTYEVTVPAKSDLGLFVATLNFGSTLSFDQGRVEIIGGQLFTEPQARTFDGTIFSDAAKYTDDDIAAARIQVTDWLEAQTGRSWVPRYRRVTLRGNSSERISLRDYTATEGPSSGEGSVRDVTAILSATIDGTALTVGNIVIDGAHLWLTSGVWTYHRRPQIVIEYEYGNPHVRDGADRTALLELVDTLPSTRLSRSATGSTDELGTYDWQPQNNGRPSRVPDVNAWVRSYDMRIGLR